jgi:hypothetical protein
MLTVIAPMMMTATTITTTMIAMNLTSQVFLFCGEGTISGWTDPADDVVVTSSFVRCDRAPHLLQMVVPGSVGRPHESQLGKSPPRGWNATKNIIPLMER